MREKAKVFLKYADKYTVSKNWGILMNEYIQNTKTMKQELEALLTNSNQGYYNEMTEDVAIFCQIMKQAYLSCSTNN